MSQAISTSNPWYGSCKVLGILKQLSRERIYCSYKATAFVGAERFSQCPALFPWSKTAWYMPRKVHIGAIYWNLYQVKIESTKEGRGFGLTKTTLLILKPHNNSTLRKPKTVCRETYLQATGNKTRHKLPHYTLENVKTLQNPNPELCHDFSIKKSRSILHIFLVLKYTFLFSSESTIPVEPNCVHARAI